MYNLLYDGTFAGFLTALNRKLHQPALELCIKPANGFEEDLYSQDFVLNTDIKLAKEMLALLKNYFTLSEIRFMKAIIKQAKPSCENMLCDYILSRLLKSLQSQGTDNEILAAA